jgi:dipeptide transport system permease protein
MANQSALAPTSSSPAPASPWSAFWHAFSQNRGAVGGLVILATIVVLALFAEWIAPYSAIEQFRGMTKLPPSFTEGGDPRFLLGTDALGRDMLSRLIFGARISLFIGLSVMIASVIIGITLGLVAAYLGGVVDSVLMRIMDLIMSIPSLVLAILVVSILGPSLTNTIVAVSVVYLPNYVRLVRGSALAEFGKEYIIAAKVAGVGPIRLMFVTVLPNCLAPLIVQAALGVSNAILEAAALGFLGLGAQPPTPEWGAMLADAREFIRSNPWIVTLPGLAILISVVSINLFGDGLRDALDPKLRRS